MDKQAQTQVPVTEPAPGTQLKADVYDAPGGDAYMIEIPVPGLKPEEIAIEATVGMITVSTAAREQPPPDRHYLQREQPAGPMSRIFEFPMEIDTDDVQATLERGVLKIRARKAVAARRRKVPVAQAA
jgi:HSP20 family protein